MDMEPVNKLLTLIEFHFILKSVETTESSATDFLQYVRQNPNSKIGFQRSLLQQIYEQTKKYCEQKVDELRF